MPGRRSPLRLFNQTSTYLSMIAVVLQGAPGKMLTFTQMMDKLGPLISENRQSVENNIRACLTINKCFVKVPVSRGCKMNYWKLDHSQITAKMVRRHFKGVLHLFPELDSGLLVETQRRPVPRQPSRHSPKPVAHIAVKRESTNVLSRQIKCEKFSSPFSIESLLKRDSRPARASRPPPLSGVPVPVMQQQPPPTLRGTKRGISWDSEKSLLQHSSPGSFPICSPGGSTHHGLTAGAVPPNKRMYVYSEASSPVCTRAGAAPHFPSSPHSYITHSVPTFTNNVTRFWL